MENKWTIGNIIYMANALVLVLAVLSMGIKAANAQDLPAATMLQKHSLRAHDHDRLAKADPVDQQLARYSRLIPQMGFLRVYGKEGARLVYQLPGLLGNGAVNMDYAHDTHQGQSLVDAQLYRIASMVEQGLPSTTLFKVGADSAFSHRYLCVVTLDTGPYRQDPAYATKFMLSEAEPDAAASRTGPYIRNEDFLRFTVEHEVFHCLNAFFNGASFRKTSNAVTSHYDHYLNELRADAYASLMLNRARSQEEDFLQRLAVLRSQSLAARDTLHVTSNIINLSSRVCLDADGLEPEEVVHMATKLVNANSPSLGEYGEHLANMFEAIERLGGNARDARKALDLEILPQYDETRVAELVQQVVTGRRQIRTNDTPASSLSTNGKLAKNQDDYSLEVSR